MNPLYQKAIIGADEVRMQLEKNIYEAVNIFDICKALGITVCFVDISMEGLYVLKEHSKPYILISSLRPFARRVFTCSHELGHHFFKHGLRVDVLEKGKGSEGVRDPDEYLVDLFAGNLLMPIAGLEAEIAKRNLSWSKITPLTIYKLASIFGTGYKTLITHAHANNLIGDSLAEQLHRYAPAKILSDVFGNGTKLSYFKIIDDDANLEVIDLEVTNYLILPFNVVIEGDQLKKFKETTEGIGYIAVRSGIARAATPDGSFAAFIRVQNYQYAGIAEYRHLETSIEDIYEQ